MMNSNQTQAVQLENQRVSVKIKLAALWTAVMFCYVYGDFFMLFVPGHIKDLMDGKSGVGDTSPLSLLSFAILMSVPSLMIFLSLVLKPIISRWTNLILGAVFTIIMILIAATSKNEWTLFYRYLAGVEIVLTCTVIWQAWTWPKEQSKSSI